MSKINEYFLNIHKNQFIHYPNQRNSHLHLENMLHYHPLLLFAQKIPLIRIFALPYIHKSSTYLLSQGSRQRFLSSIRSIRSKPRVYNRNRRRSKGENEIKIFTRGVRFHGRCYKFPRLRFPFSSSSLATTTVVNSAPAYGPDRQVCIALNGHPSLTSDPRDAGEPRFFKRIVTRSRVYTRASRRYLRNTRGQGEVRPEAAFADWSAPSSS